MDILIIQILNSIFYACILFLIAAGLSYATHPRLAIGSVGLAIFYLTRMVFRRIRA